MPLRGIPDFIVALTAYEGDARTQIALRLMVLTFARTTELRSAQWSEIEYLEGEEPLWRIPAERTKMKREHTVPLAPQAVSLLRELRLLPGSDSSPYLFPSPSKEGFMSNNTMLYALYRLGYHSRATVHGFRATASTALNEMGFRADVIERQLAHQDNNVRAAYNRAEYLPERRAMMIHWANHLDKIIDDQRISRSMSGVVTRSDSTSRHSGELIGKGKLESSDRSAKPPAQPATDASA